MEQLNLLPNNPRRLASNGDALIQASPGSWMVHPHASPMSPWHAQSFPLGSFYFTHQQTVQRTPSNPTNAQASQPSQQSTLPHPDRSVRALQNPDSVVGLPAASIYWATGLQPMSDVMNQVPENNPAAHTISVPSAPDSGLGNMNSVTRGLALQPRPAADWASPGVASDSLSATASQFSTSGRIANGTEPSHLASTSSMLAYPLSPISPPRSAQMPSAGSQQTQRSPPSASTVEYRDLAGLPSPSSDRRRQLYSRHRRALNSRQSGSDSLRPQEDSAESSVPIPRPSRRASLTDDMIARQMQMFRGTVSSKLVASKAAIQSLESVDMCTISESERTCVICYNDYGVASPEGINEAPLRLPSCKHTFGDHCIKKWLEDSDSCPYCRSKLQSEPKHSYGSARTFLNMMRMRGLPLPAGVSDEMIARLATRQITEAEFQELFNRASRPAERRPPPDDAATQDQRRTRQRRSGPVPGESLFADNRATHPRSNSESVPPSQLTHSSQDILPVASPWDAQSMPAARVPSSLPQRLQPQLVVGEAATELGSLEERREQSGSARMPQRPVDSTAPLVVNGSSLRERSLPNPIQARYQPRLDTSAANSQGTTRNAPLLDAGNSTRLPANTTLSPLRMNRNRPW